MATTKENIAAAVTTLNAAKRTHGHDSAQANAARLILTGLIRQAQEAQGGR